jgi:hypothetical protein
MTKQSQSTPKLRTPRWPAGLVPWRQAVELFLERLAKAVAVQIEILGAARSSGGDALTFEVAAGVGDTSVWIPTPATSTSIKVTAGAFRGLIPSSTTVSISSGALNYVYLKLAVTPVYIDGACVGGTFDEATFYASTSEAEDDEDHKHILLLTWEAGVATRVRTTSFDGRLVFGGAEDVSELEYWPA